MGTVILILGLLVVGACGGALILLNNPNLYARLRASRGGSAPTVPPAPAAKHVISGTVRTAAGAPLVGVSVVTAPVTVELAMTGSDGFYVTLPLVDGAYQIGARLGGYTFMPLQRGVSVAGVDVPGRDFTASA